MVLDECGPGLARFLVTICGDVLLDGALADPDPQVQQFSAYPFSVYPVKILSVA